MYLGTGKYLRHTLQNIKSCIRSAFSLSFHLNVFSVNVDNMSKGLLFFKTFFKQTGELG